MKKVAVVILAVCLMLPCFSMISFAANDGKIMFTDHNNPGVQTGSTVKVKGVVQKSRGNFGKIDITMTYDASRLNFKSGDNVTKVSSGKLQYVGDGTNVTGNRIEFYMTFEALKAGTTSIKIESATVKSVSGSVLDYEKGSSVIAITGETVEATGDATASDMKETIDGVTYSVATDIPSNEIPEGYVSQQLFDKYPAIYNEKKNLYLVYMIDEQSVGRFFMYDEDNGEFAPYEEIKISGTTSIVLLANISEVQMPKMYEKTEVTSLNGYTFPAWKNAETPDFCIVYAISGSGEKGFYQMDTAEGTYQRIEIAAVDDQVESEGWADKLNTLLQGHLDAFVIGAGAALLIFLVIIIVLSVKLFNRNAELDEIYDEYGIDEETSTEDDVELDVEEDDDEYYDEEAIADANIFLQEGMKELFPEEEVPMTVTPVVSEPVAEEEEEEDTLGAVLAQQQKEEDSYFDEDFEDFSLDIIDLDD